jgi:hypothetical protein
VIRNTFDAMEVSQNGRSMYQLTRMSVKTVFSGIVDLITLKVCSLELLSSTLKTHEVLREEMRHTSNIERIKEIVDLILARVSSRYMELPVWRWGDFLTFHRLLEEVAK